MRKVGGKKSEGRKISLKGRDQLFRVEKEVKGEGEGEGENEGLCRMRGKGKRVGKERRVGGSRANWGSKEVEMIKKGWENINRKVEKEQDVVMKQERLEERKIRRNKSKTVK